MVAAVVAMTTLAGCANEVADRTVEFPAPVLGEDVVPGMAIFAPDYPGVLLPGPVDPGFYYAAQLRTPFALTLGEGWQLLSVADAYQVQLLQDDRPPATVPPVERRLLAFLRPDRHVLDPYPAAADLGAFSNQLTVRLPDDVLSPFVAAAGEWSEPLTSTVGDRPARMVEGTVTSLPAGGDNYELCTVLDTRCAIVYTLVDGGIIALQEGKSYRIYQVDDEEGPVLILVEAPVSSFEEFLRSAEEALSSVVWEPSTG